MHHRAPLVLACAFALAPFAACVSAAKPPRSAVITAAPADATRAESPTTTTEAATISTVAAPGCESAGTTFARPTDAHGVPIQPWRAAPGELVAREGETRIARAMRGDAASAREMLPAARAWAALHADHPYGPFVVGRIALLAGDVDTAVASYEQALRIHPGFSDAEFGLGVIAFGRHQSGESQTHFERAAGIDPLHVTAYFNAGLGEYLRGDFARALDYWCAARRVQPDDFDTAKKVVQALHGLGRFDDAVRARAAARDLYAHSADPRVRRSQGYVIDQRHIGDEEVYVYESLVPGDPMMQYPYTFDCRHGTDPVRRVAFEASQVDRELGAAGLLAVEYPDGRHASSHYLFRTMPTYEALLPYAERFITELQHGQTQSIGASSGPGR